MSKNEMLLLHVSWQFGNCESLFAHVALLTLRPFLGQFLFLWLMGLFCMCYQVHDVLEACVT